ncbi:hypothetical protein ACFLV5_03060 [Chloroflexota bacterium]
MLEASTDQLGYFFIVYYYSTKKIMYFSEKTCNFDCSQPNSWETLFTEAIDPAEIMVSVGAALWGIYYLDEDVPGGEWLYFIPGFTDSTITQLEPDEYYLVIVSAPCTMLIPQ